MLEFGTLTMKNYGLRRNCSVSIIYPEEIQLVNVDVGVTSESSVYEAEVGLSDKSEDIVLYGGGDYVQLLNGNGLDTTIMRTKGILCGMDSKNGNVVRMVSSGEFHNTVTFMYAPPAESQPGTC
ncbi:hypothetical protein DPMN_048077 [Dreissena polymorpha]|uniref:Corticotropin-releasing factor binding protein C-terminal domain-containing protein n=1 Tax=Dreissena polymorpha TaxID=45954 RepID=A0A9D4I2I2_DREPO|nr:hypothetical protein DPMN_048077 [Dreissena polymorpha]